MTKYHALRDFLRQQPVSEVRLDFPAIERVLGFPLPASAFKHQAWWANNSKGHSHCYGWLDAGYESRQVDLGGRKVTFAKRSGPSADPIAPSSPLPLSSLHGRLAGTVRLEPAGDLTEPATGWSAADE